LLDARPAIKRLRPIIGQPADYERPTGRKAALALNNPVRMCMMRSDQPTGRCDCSELFLTHV